LFEIQFQTELSEMNLTSRSKVEFHSNQLILIWKEKRIQSKHFWDGPSSFVEEEEIFVLADWPFNPKPAQSEYPTLTLHGAGPSRPMYKATSVLGSIAMCSTTPAGVAESGKDATKHRHPSLSHTRERQIERERQRASRQSPRVQLSHKIARPRTVFRANRWRTPAHGTRTAPSHRSPDSRTPRPYFTTLPTCEFFLFLTLFKNYF